MATDWSLIRVPFWITVFLWSTTFNFADSYGKECKNGECLLLNLCPSLVSLMVGKKLPISDETMKVITTAHCGFEQEAPKVCCPNSDALLRRSGHKGKDIPNTSVCGIGGFPNRILGTVADMYEFPWLALLEYVDEIGGNEYRCSGSLINSKYVLTAAHCVNSSEVPSKYKLTKVHFGEFNLLKIVDCHFCKCKKRPVDIPVESFIVHPDYRIENQIYRHDIALIRLQQPVAYGENVAPICLPFKFSKSYMRSQIWWMAGWGIISNNEGSVVTRKAEMKFESIHSCAKNYNVSENNLADDYLCSETRWIFGNCIGDSGGTLMMKSEDQNQTEGNYYAIGVMSDWDNLRCGLSRRPALFTSVADHLDWILSTLRY